MKDGRIAQLEMRLKGFAEPNTKSPQEGFVDPGRYEVIGAETSREVDYHRLRMSAMLGGDTWICSRWRNHTYARILPRPELRAAGEEVLEAVSRPITAADLIAGLQPFHRFRYDLDDARYPVDLGLRLPEPPPYANNCCSFAEALLVAAWQRKHSDFTWTRENHAQFMILSNDDMFSPITAAVACGIGVLAPDDDCPPRPWTLIQGWRRQWRDGHTFLVVSHHPETDKVLTLESNHAYALDGVGFRGIGNLRDVPQPPDSWWSWDGVWTWSRICNTYRFRRAAHLAVLPPDWPDL